MDVLVEEAVAPMTPNLVEDVELRERAAQASGQYTAEEWAALVASNDPLDALTNLTLVSGHGL